MINMQKWIDEVKNLGPKLYIVLGVLALILLWLSSGKSERKEIAVKVPKKEMGFKADGIDQKAYLARLEKSYFDAQEKIKDLQDKMERVLKNQQVLMRKNLQTKTSSYDNDKGLIKPEIKDFDLSIANIAPIEKNEESQVYLPLGSFCRGTLLTGVYATSDTQQPLPVLIQIDEAFYGPNKTRIPLKGALAIGRAHGDLVSSRALIQIVSFSTVLPNGEVFESEQNLGYVTDGNGQLGVPGVIVTNTGKQLALSFVSGFLAAGAQSMADSQLTVRETENGQIIKTVTGDIGIRAGYAGLGDSASKLSSYYSKQAEKLIPAVYVPNGQKICFIVQKGMRIDGLYKDDALSMY